MGTQSTGGTLQIDRVPEVQQNVKNTPFGHQNARNGSGCGRAKTERIFVANFQAKNGTERGGMGRFSALGAPRPRLGAIFPS